MNGTDPITGTEDVIDSRDVIARIEHLTNLRDETNDDDTPMFELDDAERDELAVLTALAEEGEAYIPDWEHGEALIHAAHFEDYARELADDIGATNPDAGWPLMHIDWEAAADALLIDYTELDLNGQVYYAR